MEEKSLKVRTLAPKSSVRSGMHGDIRNLWSQATLVQPHVNMSLAEVCENFDEEGRDLGKLRGGRSQSISLKERISSKPEELEEQSLLDLELHARSSMEQKTQEPSSSASVISLSKHIPHRAYWAEQQNRLPLPLMEVMETEALEILTKALKSYRSRIGKNHFLTKELQRYIEGLKKRRSKRLQCRFQ
uniref:Testis-expressed sequence 40 protein n=1 Tax=Castor canadensis TaxID=51338 RepID=A0A8C0XKG9_CASCN